MSKVAGLHLVIDAESAVRGVCVAMPLLHLYESGRPEERIRRARAKRETYKGRLWTYVRGDATGAGRALQPWIAIQP